MKKRLDNLGFAHGLVLPIIITIVAIVGASYYVYTKNNTPQTNSREITAETTLKEPLPDSLVTVDKVKNLAGDKKPSYAIISITLKNEDGVLLYVVKLSDGTHLFFNARTGALTSGTVEDEEETSTGTLPVNLTVSIGFDQARELAVSQKPGATVQKIELETEDGVVVYNVRFTDKSRVIINSASGKIITVTHPDTKDKGKPDANGKSDDNPSNGGTSDDSPKPKTDTGDDDSGNDGGSDNGDDSGSNSGHDANED